MKVNVLVFLAGTALGCVAGSLAVLAFMSTPDERAFAPACDDDFLMEEVSSAGREKLEKTGRHGAEIDLRRVRTNPHGFGSGVQCEAAVFVDGVKETTVGYEAIGRLGVDIGVTVSFLDWPSGKAGGESTR